MGEQPDIDRAVRDVLSGNRDAFRLIIDACETKVRVVLGAILPDHDSIDDIAQEVFVTAFSKLGEYRPGSDFSAWIRSIARHMALNERKRWVRARRFRNAYRSRIEEHLAPRIERLTAPRDDSSDSVRALRECVDGLAGRAKSLLTQFYFEGKSSTRIADEHERTPGWARITLHRARQSVAECLRRKGVLGNE